MAIRKCKATVVRRVPYSESSLVVTFLSPEYGLVRGLAKGCKRPSSPLHGMLDLLETGELVYYAKRDGALHIVSEFAPETARAALRATPERFAAGAVIGEATAAFAVDEDACVQLSSVLTQSLQHIEHCARLVPAVAAGLLAVLNASGLCPVLTECIACGKALGDGTVLLDVEQGGTRCPACRGRVGESLNPPVWKGLDYCNRYGFDAADRLQLRERDAGELLRAILELVQAQAGRRLRAGGFLLHWMDRHSGR